MVSIANQSSSYGAITSLLGGSLMSAASAQPTASLSAAAAPKDSVNLSERAKATLARARSGQVLADRLSAQVESGLAALKGAPYSAKAPASANSFLDRFGGGNSQKGSSWDANSPLENRGAYLFAQQTAHTRPDGSIQSWSTSASNVFNVPSTPADIDQWYETHGKQMLAIAQALPNWMPGLAEAIQNRTVTLTDARDIPGLNFRNSFTFQGGEGGSSGGSSTSFNSSLPMFNDPNVGALIEDNGTVVSWPKGAKANT